jgi:hypothetical protein
MHFVADAPETLWAMVDGIHGGHVGKKSLAGTNIARGLLAPYMLLTSYQLISQQLETNI